MKLYVDDIRQTPEDWVIARTITEAIRYLSLFEVDEVSLDHDIQCSAPSESGLVWSAHSSEETFEPVARYLALMPQDRQPKIVHVHSANPLAFERYKDILRDTPIVVTRAKSG